MVASALARISGAKPGALKKPIWFEMTVLETRKPLFRLPKRRGWFWFARARFRAWRNRGWAERSVEKPVRMAASSTSGYCLVMALVMMLPKEWPPAATFWNLLSLNLPLRREVARMWAISTSRGVCMVWIGSGLSDLPTPRRS